VFGELVSVLVEIADERRKARTGDWKKFEPHFDADAISSIAAASAARVSCVAWLGHRCSAAHMIVVLDTNYL
jgi:hypothetical protein